MALTNESNTSAIRCRGVSKTFGGNRAVSGVDLDVEPGTVHALVGENGAGKSTLLGMISGRLSADEGEVAVFGERLTGGRPREGRDKGLVAVYQELTMVPALSAEANVFLGQTTSRRGVLDAKAMRDRFVQMCQDFDVSIPPAAPARTLSISQQQILEIMRGVQARGRVLMLDEPSAALAEHERDTLYRVLDRLRAAGTTIVFVSHNLEEVLRLSDTITVLRDGRLVRTGPRSEWDRQSIIRAMVGREVEVDVRRGVHDLGEEVFAARDVELPGVLHGISVTARAGEIVGLWGLVGSGRTTFLRALNGLVAGSSGSLTLDGHPVPWMSSARQAIAAGIVMVPESRKSGMVLGMDGASNYWLGRTAASRFWLDRRGEHRQAAEPSSYFGFRPERLGAPVKQLSGGNQQKILLAKWAGHHPKVMLVDEPTRGIDVGAKAEVLASLVRLASTGAAIVVTSSELEEVLAVCHRLLVFAEGRVVREIAAGDPDFRVADIVKLGFHEGEMSA
jgi:ribose transport system ATP-binding protein/rhamnose transport system ATP-binding protein